MTNMNSVTYCCDRTHPQEVPVHVVVQPVMDNHIPSTIVVGKRG